MYTQREIVRISKRENNTKRTYLVTNILQGKHVAVNPSKALGMFDELAETLKQKYKNEKLLLIGFAETATAIGARVAIDLGAKYMQTTREKVNNEKYIFFTESHSHATEQKLVESDVVKWIKWADRIIFVEDEVTTGNTIMKIVDILREKYSKEIKFSVASILNGMDEKALNNYNEKNVAIHYLVKTDHSTYPQRVENFVNDGSYEVEKIDEKSNETPTILPEIKEVQGYLNSRKVVDGKEYDKACYNLGKEISKLVKKDAKNILVMGTEEFMYPAIFTGKVIEDMGLDVKTHSTTRSPIAVSASKDYLFHNRYEINSFYDSKRTTFIYDLSKYDQVIIVTDAGFNDKEKQGEFLGNLGLLSLVKALEKVGNKEIVCVRWVR
ncbi:TRSP domain C terminus to PRTase_2 [Lachnospiraceae bacterium C7]|nr:TRSP domain C terminus to PRTase_2 [Lachnospiraceae bacterium C7]